MREFRLGAVMSLGILSGCLIDRGPVSADLVDAGRDLSLDAAISVTDDAATAPLDAFELDAFGLDAPPVDAFSPPDVFTPTDAFVPPDTGCTDELCNRRDDDCDGDIDEDACLDGDGDPCTTRTVDTRVYLFCADDERWTNARDRCRGFSYDLVTLEDSTENAMVASWLGPNIWIGYNDRGTEGSFEWSSGTPRGFTAWADRQPDDFFDEDCVEMRSDGRWNDEDCGRDRAFVCEGAVLP